MKCRGEHYVFIKKRIATRFNNIANWYLDIWW